MLRRRRNEMSGIIRAQRQRSPCRARIEGPAVPRACAGLWVVACATIRAVEEGPTINPTTMAEARRERKVRASSKNTTITLGL